MTRLLAAQKPPASMPGEQIMAAMLTGARQQYRMAQN
jgi:hypothetical protein